MEQRRQGGPLNHPLVEWGKFHTIAAKLLGFPGTLDVGRARPSSHSSRSAQCISMGISRSMSSTIVV